jgi:alkylhydroperoxidase family enzyme
VTALTLAMLLTSPVAQPPATETSKPVGVTRDEEKALLEKHKKAKPRLPMPPADPDNPLARVYNGAFRAYYLPPELRESRGGAGATGREPDPALTLDNTFKVKLFWITSRANNCYYCLAHQEYKLLGAGQSDDDIAALDGEWLTATPKERIAYEFTRKLTHTPHLITAADVESMKKRYTDKEVVEILVTVAGYNSTNRWTDGLNIPTETDGARFKKEGVKADFSTFLTPTSEKYAKQQTTVGPLKLSPRPALEARDKVEAIWKENRTAVLPLGDAKAVAEVWEGGSAPNWGALLANFPKSMKGRVTGLKNGMEKGNLSPKLKAQIAWIAARNDRAWYALAVARERLQKAGVSGDDVWKLDGDRKHLSEAEQAALALAEMLTVAPWKVTDEMVERCRKSFKDAEVAEIFYHTCNAAFFDRVTEVARLPLDK